jgi:hypothetical protein
MVDDIRAARIKKANAEVLTGIGGIFGLLGALCRLFLIDNMLFGRIERL